MPACARPPELSTDPRCQIPSSDGSPGPQRSDGDKEVLRPASAGTQRDSTAVALELPWSCPAIGVRTARAVMPRVMCRHQLT